MTDEQAVALAQLRRETLEGIARALKRDGHCKGYEGSMNLTMPRLAGIVSPFHPTDALDHWVLTLECYVLGPARHYKWAAKDLNDVLSRAGADIREWIAEADAEDA